MAFQQANSHKQLKHENYCFMAQEENTNFDQAVMIKTENRGVLDFGKKS